MKYTFLNTFLDKKELLEKLSGNVNPFLLANNKSQFENIYEFYNDSHNLLCINGFSGTGKNTIAKGSHSFLSEEVITIEYNCFNSTILDDILLSFYKRFKTLISENMLNEPKVKSENFTQKINAFFTQTERPFVIIINSFEAILEENRQEILDFILHLVTFNKVKVILISKTFENKYFKEITPKRVTTFALERNIFDNYLKEEKIKAHNAIIDEFYKHTRGYYFLTSFSIKLMNHQSLTIVEFLTKLKESYLTFYEYLEKQAGEIIPPDAKTLFLFLSMIRHPISISLLKTLNIYDEERINELKKILVLFEEDSQIYVQDFFREVEFSISPNIEQRIRQYIIDLYQTQLPLKPLERNLPISRQTMRKEIEYQKFFLPKKLQMSESQNVDINFLAYSKGLEIDYTGAKHENIRAEKQEQSSKVTTAPIIEPPNKKNISINLENLPYQKKTAIPDSNFETDEQPSGSEEKICASLKECINKAIVAENKYSYTQAIELFTQALLFKDDLNYNTYLPKIHKAIAKSYKNLARYDEAIANYEKAYVIYEKDNNTIKSNFVKLNIAKICFESYKMEKAKEILVNVVINTELPPILLIKSYILLAHIEEGLNTLKSAFGYYKKAFELSEQISDIETLSELYFQFALMLDENGNQNAAIELYNKCINLKTDTAKNKFLSSCYSNIANLYLEKNNADEAILNYIKAFELEDEDNAEGIYYSASKLASILQRKKPDEALKYLEKALDAARKTDDIFYIASASLAIGDFYYDKAQNEIALKYYFNTKNLVLNTFNKENIEKIDGRINDIKFRLGEDSYNKVIKVLEGTV